MSATISKTFGGYPFVPDVFNSAWDLPLDPTLTAIIESGAVVNDPAIASLIASEGYSYSTRFHNPLSGDPGNYDGATNVPTSETSAGTYTGVIYGRTKGWTEKDFKAIISGEDPMAIIGTQVGKYWDKYRQKLLVMILDAIFGITGGTYDTEWKKHTLNLAPQEASQEKVLIGANSLNDLATQALGDNKGKFRLAIMHSQVAKTLENMQRLEFWKYTDANGMQRRSNIADIDGMTAIIDDGVTVSNNSTSGHDEYSTYILGEGAIRYAKYDLGERTSGVQRDEVTNGGQETLVTRIRETLHPAGLSFKGSPASNSPTDEELKLNTNWEVAIHPKNIAIARLITNG